MVNDIFGIALVYPTKANGETWTLSTNPDSDNRFDPGDNINSNSDSSFSLDDNDGARVSVFTTSGYLPDDIQDDHGELDIDAGGRGYMQSPNDWKNVEITGAFKMGGPNDELSFYCRGGRHNDSIRCEGFKYTARFHVDDGKIDFAKEQWHVSYVFSNMFNSPWGGSIENDWVLAKFVVYNFKPSGSTRTGVKLEAWTNPSFDKITWVKSAEYTDVGGWGDSGDECGGTPDQIGNWGGPIVTYRWDNQDSVSFKWLSVREIQPSGSVNDGGGVDNPLPTDTPAGFVESITSHKFSVAAFVTSTCDGEITSEPPSDPVPPNPPDTTPPPSSRITTYLADNWKVP